MHTLVSGVIALILESNPDLTWRDVRISSSIAPGRTTQRFFLVREWEAHVSHKYGFGAVDAGAAVSLAENWTAVERRRTLLLGLYRESRIETDQAHGPSSTSRSN